MITLSEFYSYGPSPVPWAKLLTSLNKTKADDMQITLMDIYKASGALETLWACRVLPETMDSHVRLLLCDIVESAIKYIADPTAQEAIDTCRKYVRDALTDYDVLHEYKRYALKASMEAVATARDALRKGETETWALSNAIDSAWSGVSCVVSFDARYNAWDAGWVSVSAHLNTIIPKTSPDQAMQAVKDVQTAEQTKQDKIVYDWLVKMGDMV